MRLGFNDTRQHKRADGLVVLVHHRDHLHLLPDCGIPVHPHSLAVRREDAITAVTGKMTTTHGVGMIIMTAEETAVLRRATVTEVATHAVNYIGDFSCIFYCLGRDLFNTTACS